MEPIELRARLTGLMSFPVTPFDSNGQLDLQRFREHVQSQLETPATGIFAACGTGEMFSLTPAEHRSVVEAAVQEVKDTGKPVIAGVGYGTAIALQMAESAEAAGADGVLVLPPYLVTAEQDGLFEHYRRIAAAVNIGIIPYQRDNGLLTPQSVRRLAEIPNVVGLKDGHGDADLLTRVRLATEGRIALMNGMPTAELTSMAFRACGVESYSSAVLNFVPEIAAAYFEAFSSGDLQATDRLLNGFFRPFVELRDVRAGYAVALVKAGINIRGAPVGDVRPPLVSPSPEHLARLEEIIDQGLDLV